MTETTVQAQLDEGVVKLFQMSEAELELELGKRLTQTRKEISSNKTLSMAVSVSEPTVDKETLQALPEFVRKVAHRFLSNFNAQMYGLICDSSDPDNNKLRDAAAKGAESLGLVLSGVFVATFGWLPGIATVVAVIVAKRFARSSYDAVCSTWKEQL